MITARKEQKDQVTDAHGQRWQTVYCSFALILVVFFVMIASHSIVSGKSVALVQEQFSPKGVSKGSDSSPSSLREQKDTPFVVLHDAAKQFDLGQDVTLKMTSTGIDIILPGHLFFDADKSGMEGQLFPYLNVVGDVAAKNGFSLQIKVYDDLSRGKDDTSWEQAAHRTVNIMRYFLAYGRLSPDQVTASGFLSQESFPPGSHAADQGRVELHLAVKSNQ